MRIALAGEDAASAKAYGMDRTCAVFIVGTTALSHRTYRGFGTHDFEMDQLRGGDKQAVIVSEKITALPAAPAR